MMERRLTIASGHQKSQSPDPRNFKDKKSKEEKKREKKEKKRLEKERKKEEKELNKPAKGFALTFKRKLIAEKT